MQINAAALDAMYFNFVPLFDGAFQRTQLWHEKVATVAPSTTRENRYPWLKNLPGMRKWVGERKLNNLVARAYAIINEDYEDTVAIDRNDIEDDNLGVYDPMFRMFGEAVARWPDQLIARAIKEGVTQLCWDGQAFFDTDHPIDADDASKGTFSNLFDLELNHTNYSVVRTAMMTVKDDQGEALNIMPRLLVVPPQLEDRARQILNADFIAPAAGFGLGGMGTQTNTLKGSAELLVIPELSTEPDAWYLLDVSKPVKPFIMQKRKTPTLVTLFDATSKNVFFDKKFIFGSDARGNFGYSLPFLAARSKPA